MDQKKKEFLTSLLTWASEVEETINKISSTKSDVLFLLEQIQELKSLINEKLNAKEEISDESINELQEKGQKLFESLQSFLNKERNAATAIAPGEHKLPNLPYDYDALEPYISKQIMQLHHKKHHQSYVEGLNKAEKELYKGKTNKNLLKHWMREQAFNGSGHYLHTIFWNNMSPKGGGTPKGALLSQIKKDFGSFNNFKQLFTQAAASVEGVGWAILVWQPRAGRLGIQTVEKHQQFHLADTIPLLVLDVWEHAYYLQYQNKREEYVNNWWNVVHWNHVEKRFDQAKQLMWPLY